MSKTGIHMQIYCLVRIARVDIQELGTESGVWTQKGHKSIYMEIEGERASIALVNYGKRIRRIEQGNA